MSYELTGKVVTIEPINQVSDKFKKCEFVVEVKDGNYAELIKLQLVNDKCSLIDGVKPDQEVKVHFNLRGRRYEKNGVVMYFNSLDAWKIEAVSGVTVQTSAPAQPFVKPELPETDDLPF